MTAIQPPAGGGALPAAEPAADGGAAGIASTAAVDAELAVRAQRTADVIAGLIAAGTLQRVGEPAALPRLLWPDVDPGTVQAIWDAGAAAGYWAGSARARSRWETDDLDAARRALADAGYTAMAGTVHRAAYAAPSRPAPGADTPSGGRP